MCWLEYKQHSKKCKEAMFAWNMTRYSAFMLVCEISMKFYKAHEDELKKMVASDNPVHEIINTFGNDFDEMLKNVKQ